MFSDFITGKEYTINEKKKGMKELISNEGYWITDNIICETSSFTHRITTKFPERHGTVTDAEKIEIERMQQEYFEELAELENN